MYKLYRLLYGLVGFSRSQTNAFLLFLPLLLGCLAGPWLAESYIRNSSHLSSDSRFLDSLVSMMSVVDSARRIHPVTRTPFDPNTASINALVEAGFDSTLASRISRYRDKGGKFFKKEDLLRIWGIDSAFFREVEPFISIAVAKPKFSNTEKPSRDRQAFKKEDINTADTTSLRQIYGIGEKLSLRIVKYREALGGFIRMDQVGEVYRIDSAVVERVSKRFEIKHPFEPRKLNLNTAGRQDLATHPYITDKAASAIVAYRFQHGPFNSIDDLRKIQAVDSAMIKKSAPYLKVSE